MQDSKFSQLSETNKIKKSDSIQINWQGNLLKCEY